MPRASRTFRPSGQPFRASLEQGDRRPGSDLRHRGLPGRKEDRGQRRPLRWQADAGNKGRRPVARPPLNRFSSALRLVQALMSRSLYSWMVTKLKSSSSIWSAVTPCRRISCPFLSFFDVMRTP